jgi:hypothetical protein
MYAPCHAAPKSRLSLGSYGKTTACHSTIGHWRSTRDIALYSATEICRSSKPSESAPHIGQSQARKVLRSGSARSSAVVCTVAAFMCQHALLSGMPSSPAPRFTQAVRYARPPRRHGVCRAG